MKKNVDKANEDIEVNMIFAKKSAKMEYKKIKNQTIAKIENFLLVIFVWWITMTNEYDLTSIIIMYEKKKKQSL